MREILFRGKRIDNGEWVYGDIWHGYDSVPRCIADFCGRNPVIPESVSQYTGLIDRDGTKIFEGDIVEADTEKWSCISVVKYGGFKLAMFYDLLGTYQGFRPRENCFGLYFDSTKEQMIPVDSKFLKVIDNIHDNPNFFKGGADNGN